MNTDLIAALEALPSSKVKTDAPLVKRTWWRAGGTADVLVDVGHVDDLCAVQALAAADEVPVFVLGNASNLLVSDHGIRGIVVRLVGALAQCDVAEGHLVAGGGFKLVVLTSRMLRHGWAGVEWAAGIPGTIGGAVRMNAGTTLGEVVDSLVEVDVVLPDGTCQTVSAGDLNMSYRTCHLPAGAIVASARFRLADTEAADSKATIEHHLERRKATQPIDQPSCGSTFRNPVGDTAGRLIDSAGLKGFAIGAAQVSTKHANFIVNQGGATADDIRKVLEHVQATVFDVHSVRLHQEVHFVGDWSHWPC